MRSRRRRSRSLLLLLDLLLLPFPFDLDPLEPLDPVGWFEGAGETVGAVGSKEVEGAGLTVGAGVRPNGDPSMVGITEGIVVGAVGSRDTEGAGEIVGAVEGISDSLLLPLLPLLEPLSLLLPLLLKRLASRASLRSFSTRESSCLNSPPACSSTLPVAESMVNSIWFFMFV